MKYILTILSFLFAYIGFGQAIYNPSNSAYFQTTNKSYGVSQAIPTDGRSKKLDSINRLMRPYNGVAEVLTYLPSSIPAYRQGQFPIYVNIGGSLQSNGTFIGGYTEIYLFKNGVADSNLVIWNYIQSVNGQIGNVVVANGDSIKKYPIDTSAAPRNNYLLTFDSTDHKWYLTPPASGYTQGTGIIISGNTISGDNTNALWNANALRGRSLATAAPVVGQFLGWNGIAWTPLSGTGLDTAYLSTDTLYLVSGSGDTLNVSLGGLYTASNGLTLTGQNFTLGGNLSQNTTIGMNGHNFSVTNGSASNETINLQSQNTSNSNNSVISANPATGIGLVNTLSGQTTQIAIGGGAPVVIGDQQAQIGALNQGDYSTNILATGNAHATTRSVGIQVHDSLATHPGVTSISQGYGIINTPNPITTTGTIKADTATLFPAVRATIPSSGLTSTYVGYGSGSNLLTGTSNFTFNNSLSRLTADTALLINTRFSGTQYQKLTISPIHTGSSGATLRYAETLNFDSTTYDGVVDLVNGYVGTTGYVRVGLENKYQQYQAGPYWYEAHLPEVMLSTGQVYRPASWTGNVDTATGTWSYRADSYNWYRGDNDNNPRFSFNNPGNFNFIGNGQVGGTGGVQITLNRDSLDGFKYILAIDDGGSVLHTSLGRPNYYDGPITVNPNVAATPFTVNVLNSAISRGIDIEQSSSSSILSSIFASGNVSGTNQIFITNTNSSGDVAFSANGKGNVYTELGSNTEGWLLNNNPANSNFEISNYTTFSHTPNLAITQTNLVGINTATPDSTLSIIGSEHTTGGIRHDNLPKAVGTKVLRYNPSTGIVSYADTTAAAPTYTFSTGLTNTSGTVTNDVITGKAGGNTWSGGTNANDGLNIQSTTNGTKGNIVIGTSGATAYITMRGWQVRDIQETNSTSMTLGAAYTYVSTNTGATTWTLPVIASVVPIGTIYNVKNAGTSNVTLNAGAGNNIYTTSAVSSITITPGQNYFLQAGASNWYSL